MSIIIRIIIVLQAKESRNEKRNVGSDKMKVLEKVDSRPPSIHRRFFPSA